MFIPTWIALSTLVHYSGKKCKLNVVVRPIFFHISILYFWCLKWNIYDFEGLRTPLLSLRVSQGNNYANEIHRTVNKFFMTPPHHSAQELKNFTVFDDSDNVIIETQLRSKKSYFFTLFYNFR